MGHNPVVAFGMCEWKVIVQGDEGPVGGVHRLLIVMESPSVIRKGRKKR